MVRSKLMLSILLGLLAVAASPGEAATLRVEQDGSAKFTVIQDAVDVAAVGDTILIGPGTYSESRPFTTDFLTEDAFVAVSVDSLLIRGTDRDSVTIGPSIPDRFGLGPWGIAMSREFVSSIRIERVTVRNVVDGFHLFNEFQLTDVAAVDCRKGVLYFGGTGSAISRALTRSCQNGISTGSGVSDLTISECEFEGNTNLGISINRTTDAVVADCVFTDDGGVQFSDGSTGLISSCYVGGANTIVSVGLNTNVVMNNCIIEQSGINVSVKSRSHLSGSGNVLRGGFVKTMAFAAGSTASFHGNHILRNGNAPIVETDTYGVEPIQIDLTGNYWGTSSRDSIDAWTLDGEELHNPPLFENFSEILFEPFESEPVATEKETVGSLKGRY